MLSRENIRGLLAVVIIIMLAVLIALVARPRINRYAAGKRQKREKAEPVRRDSLFVFDPNTVTYEELRAMGFDKNTAVGIVKYRAMGKVFAIREDFALCYGVNDSIYDRLKPYIRIGEEYAAKPRPRVSDTVSTGHEKRRFVQSGKPRSKLRKTF